MKIYTIYEKRLNEPQVTISSKKCESKKGEELRCEHPGFNVGLYIELKLWENVFIVAEICN